MTKLLVAVLTLVLANTAMAQEKGKKKGLLQQVQGQQYGMAGCGLGSILFGDEPGIVQIFASTTNGFSGSQTFGISTGTLNCGESGYKESAQAFIRVNQVALENDLARGQGETLVNLANVLSCKNASFESSFSNSYRTNLAGKNATAEQLGEIAIAQCNI